MKTAIRTILCAAAVVMAAVSCQKSAEPVQPAEEGKETIDICVNGLMGEYTQVDQSKAQLVNNVRVSWEGGETVYVFDGVKCLGSLAAALEGTEDRYAILSTDDTHTVSTPASGTTTLTLVYSPLLTKTPTVNAGEISVSLASQNGEKAPFVAYATLDYTGTTITDAVVPFKFATSVIKVNCTGLKASTAITSATLSNVNTECKLTLSGTAAPSVSGDINGTITRTGDAYFAADKVNEEGEAVFQIAVPALEAASEARVLAVKQGSSKVKDKNFSMKKIAAATSVNTVCQLSSIPIPDGALPGVFTVSNDYGRTKTQIYFSQGNLWYGKVGDAQTATFQFEANQYDTTPSSKGARVENHISHFMWCKSASESVNQKYSETETGTNDKFFTDNDDFAVNGYSGWRVLTGGFYGEWSYLLNSRNTAYSNNRRYAAVKVNGMAGLLIFPDEFSSWPSGAGTEPQTFNTYSENWNGKDCTVAEFTVLQNNGCVFLPAAGWRNGLSGNASVSDVGDIGYYWSASTFEGTNDRAYHLYFASGIVFPSTNDRRDSAFAVRLVTECQ